MANTIIASAVLPGSVDTPLDARSRVSGVPDILNIENPYIGQLVYCTGDGKYYIVRSLKAKQIGVFLVENAAVDRYEEFSSGSGEPTAAGDISIADPDGLFEADNVEDALRELRSGGPSGTISAELVTFAGQDGGFEADNVEDALIELARKSPDITASDITFTDPDGLFEADNVEDALIELAEKDVGVTAFPASTITLPIPSDSDGDNLSLVLDISSGGTFEEDDEGVPVNYCRITMIDHYAKMRVFRNDVWETLSENCVGMPDYGSSVEFTLDTDLFPGYLPGTKYYARYKWLDTNYAGDDWTGFSFRGDVAHVRPIRLPDDPPPEVKDHGSRSGTLSFDFADGEVQNFSLSGDASLDLADVSNVPHGGALILNCSARISTLTVSNGSGRTMTCAGNKVFVVVVTNFGSLQIAVTETV